ncbi:RNA polymerase sigma factor [Nocardiopsis ansamitocini]|uniref:Uncharacterized protein n=1 Tax=Nocardiopsis ansamitocini TaxID=1670832 RepID=A0A9W6UG71_9ACTN|nr:sigma-70 family RNA polymerase sigma factor [Nocardiopsis ansamitocini]GLU46696.1 hypothetical protein Nans01_10470 [Nocardiopsis ansamitocini]
MTTQRRPGHRHDITDDGEFVILLREGRGHEQCYDTFAPALYRYCWIMLGPCGDESGDAPGEAVREAFLAAVELRPQLRDREAFKSWLFALARTACQRRGFTRRSPYAALAVVPAERPMVEAMSQVPPSHRELLELNLRHGLTSTEIATVLGLDPETVSELCRSALRRVTDLLSEQEPVVSAHRAAGPQPLTDIAGTLIGVALPGPPAALRARVLEECTAQEAAAARLEAAAIVRPLRPDGFPLHRPRGPVGTLDITDDFVEDLEQEEDLTSVRSDRTTTADVPARRTAEPVAELVAATGKELPGPQGEDDRRSRWLVPAAAGVATAVVACSLWGMGAFLQNRPSSTVADGLFPGERIEAPVDPSDTTAEPPSDHNPGPAPATDEQLDPAQVGTAVPETASPGSLVQETEAVEAPGEQSPGSPEQPAPPVEQPGPEPEPAPEQPEQPVVIPPVEIPDEQPPGRTNVVTELVGGVLGLLGLGA